MTATDASPMSSPWGQALEADPQAAVLPEHPDPIFERSDWVSLNGWWDYAIRPNTAPESLPSPFDEATAWDGQIRVPFAVEWALSGVKRPFQPDEVLHYHRRVDVPEEWAGRRIRLSFGAVDHECAVYVDGQLATSHVGGYIPFSVVIDPTDAFDLDVVVKDPTDSERIQRGKQALLPVTIWYTATSGIWQSVWMEALPADPAQTIQSIDIRPNATLDGFLLYVRTESDGAPRHPADASSIEFTLTMTTPDGQEVMATGKANQWMQIRAADPQLWSPESPHLYRFAVRLGSDEARTYSALRSVGLSGARRYRMPWTIQTRKKHDQRVQHIVLNGQPIFLNAPLQQGYWPESGLTAPSDDALIHDLQVMKDMGFNGVRVHIKVESRRFYYHCDRMGLLVVQDMVSGGRPALGIKASGVCQALDYTLPDRSQLFYDWTGRGDSANRKAFAEELAAMIRHLKCHPSIIMWVPHNEGWGQFDAARAEKAVRRLDPTRLVDAVSGWFDQGGGDFRSRHRYVLRLIPPPAVDRRPFYLSEFGGLNLAVEGHTWDDPLLFGYRFLPDREALAQAMTELYREQLIPLVARGLRACTYTQVSDVERENNGLMTYDREVTKVDPALMRQLNGELYAAFDQVLAQRVTLSS